MRTTTPLLHQLSFALSDPFDDRHPPSIDLGIRPHDPTPRAYIAPEPWLGGPHTPLTDQDALAVMIFEMLSGRLPLLEDAAADAYVHTRIANLLAWPK